jgi:hypothetical protein
MAVGDRDKRDKADKRDKVEPVPGSRTGRAFVPDSGRVRIIALADALKLPAPEPAALSASPALLKSGA